MDFVDDFRYYGDTDMLAEPFRLTNEPIDALLAQLQRHAAMKNRLRRQAG